MKRSVIVVALLLAAVPLAAQMGGGRMPGMRGNGNFTMMSDVAVGTDGTAFVVRRAGTSSNYEVAAIRPTGTVAWTFALPQNQAATTIATNGTTVFVSLFGTTGTFPNLGLKSSLAGLSVASGAPFTVDLDGIAMDIETYTDGAYVVEVSAGSTGMPMTSFGRKLLSVTNAGKVNFTLPLD